MMELLKGRGTVLGNKSEVHYNLDSHFDTVELGICMFRMAYGPWLYRWSTLQIGVRLLGDRQDVGRSLGISWYRCGFT